MGDDERLSSLLREGSGTSGSGEGAEGSGEDESGLRADNTRLRQRVARLEELTQQSVPFVDAIKRLATTELGKQVIEKLQKGENVDELMKKETKELEKQAASAGLTKEELDAVLKERDQRLTNEIVEGMRVSMDAREGVRALDAWAEKELPGFEALKGTPAWAGYLSAAQAAIKEGTLELPEGKDPYRELYKRVYNMCVAEDPDIAKKTKKAAPKTPEDRLAEIVSSGSTKPSSSSSQDIDEDNMPEEYKRQLAFIRGIKGGSGPAGIGLSFANPKKKG